MGISFIASKTADAALVLKQTHVGDSVFHVRLTAASLSGWVTEAGANL